MFSQIYIYEIVAGVSVVSWFLSSKMNGFSQETDNLGSFPAKQQKPSIAKQTLQRKISVAVPRCRETHEVCVAMRK